MSKHSRDGTHILYRFIVMGIIDTTDSRSELIQPCLISQTLLQTVLYNEHTCVFAETFTVPGSLIVAASS